MAQQPIFLRGIIATLRTMAGKIIGLLTSVREALEQVWNCEPEVAVLDTPFETFGLFEFAQQVRTCSLETAVILLSEREGEEWLFQARKLEGSGRAVAVVCAIKHHWIQRD